MKVILKEDVKNLGTIGSIVNVANGYARNYLIPLNLAVEARMKNVKALEHEKRMVEEKARKIKGANSDLAGKLSATAIVIPAKAGEEEKLFGSITSMDIAEALKAKGFEIDKKKIILDEPIKRLGSFTVNIKLHTDITAHVNVTVVPE
jgi:large subunit ribosomal protein L9